MEEDGVSSRPDNLRRHVKRGREKETEQILISGWILRMISKGGVDVDGMEIRKGYPYFTERGRAEREVRKRRR